MRSELIRAIFAAVAQGDKQRFLEVAREVIDDEEKKNHHLLARDLKGILRQVSNGALLSENSLAHSYRSAVPIPRDTEKGFPLLEIKEFYLDWQDVVLDRELETSLKQIVVEFSYAEVLFTYGLRPKQRVLFCGPPGTGKTLSAQIISAALRYPLAYIRFDSIVSSFLGETASNLRRIFDFIDHGQWVVLFDEFDVIGKHRDDPHEHGEIKRVVNNFMQMLDNYSGESLLIAATNHQYLLDPGLWRRFDEILFFDMPDPKRRAHIFRKYLKALEVESDLDWDRLIEESASFSASDIAQVCREALKTAVIEDKRRVGLKELLAAIAQQRRRKMVEGRRNG